MARDEGGRVVFVSGALPGELVDAEVVDERPDFARAFVVHVVEPAPGRRTPPCSYVAAGCGGCGWQHADEATQREAKRAIVIEALRRTGGLADAAVARGPDLAATGFRTTVRMAVDCSGGAGFRASASHRHVPVDACLVTHPLLAGLVARSWPGADEVTLRCGVATGERLVVASRAGRPAPSALVGLPGDVAHGPAGHYHEVVAGARLQVSGGSFFQTRHDGAEALVAVVRAALGADLRTARRSADLYGGVGLFAATVLAGTEVTLVERSASSCRDAKQNLLGAATVVEGDVGRWRPRTEPRGTTPIDLVVADPARPGLGKPGTATVVATRAPCVVLVSCDPASLARDARLLGASGYAHVSTTLVDLFPQTPHIEAVTRFELR